MKYFPTAALLVTLVIATVSSKHQDDEKELLENLWAEAKVEAVVSESSKGAHASV